MIYMYNDYDAIYIAGDLNGRIGNKCDFIEQVDDIPNRNAIDPVVKGHGEAIIDFCHEAKFCVINGRFSPVNDNFTSISTKGSAVVDYFVTNHDNLNYVKSFQVVTMTNLVDQAGVQLVGNLPSKISDHSMLIMDVSARDMDAISANESSNIWNQHRPCLSEQTDLAGSGDIPVLPPRFKITNVPDNFMTSEETRSATMRIIERVEESIASQEEINAIYNDIVGLYINEMTKTFAVRSNTPSSNNKFRFTRKEWWDEDLTTMFKTMQKAEHAYLKAKKCGKNFKDLQAVFKTKQATFDKQVKKKKRIFQRERCTQLENINASDPNSFWDYIKRLGPKKKSSIPMECYDRDGSVIQDEDFVMRKWKNDFFSLYNPGGPDVNKTQSKFKKFIVLDNERFEQSSFGNDESINSAFSYEEIDKVISKSKKNKAPSMDGIVYDILKNENTTILLTKLFNLCFNNHKVPDVWLQSLIYPIPKSPANDPRIPLNYRGISLLSVISKLYTAALNKRL